MGLQFLIDSMWTAADETRTRIFLVVTFCWCCALLLFVKLVGSAYLGLNLASLSFYIFTGFFSIYKMRHRLDGPILPLPYSRCHLDGWLRLYGWKGHWGLISQLVPLVQRWIISKPVSCSVVSCTGLETEWKNQPSTSFPIPNFPQATKPIYS